MKKRTRFARLENGCEGVTLIETMVAVVVALLGVFSLGSVVAITSVTDKNQGSEATRATVYAQDKMEKLLSLDFNNTSDPNSCIQPASSQPVSCNTTGISSSSWTQGLLAGGSLAPTEPSCGGATPGYQDFLDVSGSQITGSSCGSAAVKPAYVRQWAITDLTPPSGGPAIKQITVAVYSLSATNPLGGIPLVELISLLSSPN